MPVICTGVSPSNTDVRRANSADGQRKLPPEIPAPGGEEIPLSPRLDRRPRSGYYQLPGNSPTSDPRGPDRLHQAGSTNSILRPLGAGADPKGIMNVSEGAGLDQPA